ncbi:MAG TPA: twin-arginine translocation signal domain-containing protein [Phycisphaerales bacterium]|nr:twin-arginine translocation signal domain-containing protein [Phycisphaerales bacterium]
MNRRDFLKAAGLGAAALAIPTLAQGANKVAKKPNLLFVFADQFRRQAMGFMNQDPVITPNFDRFAQDSLVFTNAISSYPLCSPFRAMLMTGRFPLTTGITSNCQPGLDLELSEDEIGIGDVLKADGYQTGYIGKWHLDCPSRNKIKNPPDEAGRWDAYTPPGPRRHGFDFWYAYNGDDTHFAPHYWKDSPKKIEVKQWSVEHETDIAIDFIRNRKKDKPFALFISWNPPHPPFIAPEKYKSWYLGKELPKRPNFKIPDRAITSSFNKYERNYLAYCAAVSSCDDNFGRLLRTLDGEKIANDTVAVFTSDHGEMLGSHGRFTKHVWFEESIGIPFLIRWPGRIGPGREDMPFASYDFMPTLLGLMGMEIPDTVEGTDYSGVMLDKEVSKPFSAFIAKYGNCGKILAVGQRPTERVLQGLSLREKGIDWRTVRYRGLRTKRYTYVVDRGPEGKTMKRLLYDNEKDPYQLNPVQAVNADENPIMAKLDKELQRWLDKMRDPFPLK